MAQENYVEGCSMQRTPLLEPNGFCFWKARFETYVKSKDINLWQVIENDDFYFEVEDSETREKKETSYELYAKLEGGAVENVVENESHFSLEVVDQDLSPLAMFTIHLMRKDNKDKSEQNQSKPTKKRKRQDKSEEWKPILKAGSARYNKKRVNEEPIEEKGLIMSSFKITRAHLMIKKSKGQNCKR
ncbi:hypothetical protein Tco_1411188 [Tanacetum coccineum]